MDNANFTPKLLAAIELCSIAANSEILHREVSARRTVNFKVSYLNDKLALGPRDSR